ncbi:M23 family metallopeptidase [Streptomyces sp. R527F]|uniref:M23 family metallopeptidase n=1 Tax=Streptomyces sp. R527F TaxID=1664033 RepID=UPI001F218DB5|nr:M23 family metallopeptidase [Streptomyces sp. R527F]UIZ14938.1 peptidoglycan DD-metalloendopeptidase family protein [Streptomyces sp. R527F]
MNDQHPHAGHVGYDDRSTGSFDTDPLFGSLPGGHDTGYDVGHPAAGYGDASYGQGTYGDGYATAYATGQPDHSGQYDASAWSTGAQQTLTHDGYAAQEHLQDHPQQAHATQQWDTSGAWQQVDDQDLTGQWATADTGAFPTTGFPSAPYGTDAAYGAEAYDTTGAYGTGAYETAAYETGAYPSDTAYGTGGAYGADAYETGTYATTAFTTGAYDTGVYETGAYGTVAYDTGAYDATAWNSGATPGDAAYEPEQTSQSLYEQQQADMTAPEGPAEADGTAGEPVHDASSTAQFDALAHDIAPDAAPDVTPEPEQDAGDGFPDPYSVNRTAVRPPAPRNRARRRTPAKRSALLTVAVPSACVMSVAGIAAASVGGMPGGEEKPEETTTSLAVADPSTVQPVAANNRLDSQLAQLSEGSDDFRERASRTQERIDLRERQAAEKKKREEEAARREALRPKFVLPVKQHGLSAYYGQAGVNWMSVHSGIDFPVSYGTPVMAATDGTVRTQLNSAYGVMAIVTAADGTETWYCHLSSTKIRSGPVKAGDVIAYSGNSGNSTGPHLHFEVRPGGGAAIDPLVWLRSKGLNPA